MGVSVKGKDNQQAEGDKIGKAVSLIEAKKIESEQPLAGGGISKDVQKSGSSRKQIPSEELRRATL